MLENVCCYAVVENTRVFTAEAQRRRGAVDAEAQWTQRTQRPAEKKSLLYCSESLALRLCGEGFNQLNFYEPTTPLD